VSATVTIGVFDGLHLGHQRILARALERARGGPCVVVSFDPHPDVVLARNFRPAPPLTPVPEKRERLRAMGFARLDVLPFTRELAALEPEAFVDRHLVRPYRMGALVVGEGFALGRGRSGTVERLRQIGATRGFEVEAVPLFSLDGEAVSSTRIREALSEGRARDASRWLGRPYALAGRVVPGEAIGRGLGFPTANLRLHDEKFLPADGVYVARARIEGEAAWRPAALSLGLRPTFDGQARAIEVFLLDWSGDLMGHGLEVELVDWIRPQERFPSPEALVEAMERDVARVRERLGPAGGAAPAPAPAAEPRRAPP
jgi:riboflavin kinase/FMN adenylyltransferase